VEEEQEKLRKRKERRPSEAEREKAQDLKYKDWLEQHKHEYVKKCQAFQTVDKEYDENNPKNPNYMNVAVSNAALSFFGKGELVILAQRERMRMK